MKEIKNEQIIINCEKNDKIKLFFNCIKSSNTINYLEKEDIINLSKCSKSVNSFVEENNLLLLNLLQNNHSQ